MDKMCPRCGKPIYGYPAISRLDNETEICSDCGTIEALADFFNYAELEGELLKGDCHEREDD